ncbi:DUF2267 domain-containing protein [Actinoplanes sp. NPDC051411]|uniref:DUF2267 domain-containing protein n=1 Tax=Actinoplanes sp. NPDC051411 TaxID=3155522 RepID=UPI003432A3B5
MAKEMEGDNQKRRQLARAAREQGLSAGAAGVSLGGSKQREHAEHARRQGPPDAGTHKPGPQAARPRHDSEPAAERPSRAPQDLDPGTDPGAPRLRYRELVSSAAAWAALSFGEARDAARATVTVLAGMLGEEHAGLLRDAMPAELLDEPDAASGPVADDDFVGEVARRSGIPPEQARVRAEAVFAAIADQTPGLLGALDLPAGAAELVGAPVPGGGLVGPGGHSAPLDDEELREALDQLPDWTGDRRALERTVVLPPDELDRVLARLDRIKQEAGRGPHISRPDPQTAVLTVRTTKASAVTAADITLARRVDEAIIGPGE